MSIAGCLELTVADKARDVFYSEWILHPCNHGTSPGYMDVLPVMDSRVTSTSALHLAVEAFALANTQNFTLSSGHLRDMAGSKYW
jgi:hypothetical protein